MARTGLEHIFFDCDDTLYWNSWATASRLNAKFGAYCEENFGIPEKDMLELYKTHGTTLCGLTKEAHIREDQVMEFLHNVHDISLEEIQPDLRLRSMLLSIPHRRWVFTAATKRHAERCLQRLGIEDCFEGIIACSSSEVFQKAGYVSKHDIRCFEFAMDAAGVPREEASKCLLLDDSASNLKTAKAVGWSTVLVGLKARNGSMVDRENADVSVGTIHEIMDVLPELFSPKPEEVNCMKAQEPMLNKLQDVPTPSLKRERVRVIKPFASSPERRVLRRVGTPLSPRNAVTAE